MWFNSQKCLPEPSPNSHYNWAKPQKTGTKIIPLLQPRTHCLIWTLIHTWRNMIKRYCRTWNMYIYICIYIYLFHMLVLCTNKYYRSSLDFMLQILTIKYLPTNNFKFYKWLQKGVCVKANVAHLGHTHGLHTLHCEVCVVSDLTVKEDAECICG